MCMVRWGIVVLLSAGLVAVSWLAVSKHHDFGVVVHVEYDSVNSNQIKSETTYIPDSTRQAIFSVCESRDGGTACVEIYGVRHGAQRWYDNGIVKIEDFYDYGNLSSTILYYENGYKQKEMFYRGNKLTQENLYSDKNNSDPVETTLYKSNEKIKKYYAESKNIYKEEKYRNDRLISRRIYDNNGLLQRLEEYDLTGNSKETSEKLFDNIEMISPFLFDNNTEDEHHGKKPGIEHEINIKGAIWV